MQRLAAGKIKRGIPGAPIEAAQHLLGVIQAVKKSNGSYKQTVELMRDLGEQAFKSKNYLDKNPVDVKQMRDLYFTLRDGLTDTARTSLGEKAAEDLVNSNKIFTEFFHDKSFVSKSIGSKTLSPEGVFKNLVLNGDSSKIASLKKLLSPEQLQNLKGEFLNSIIKRNTEGQILYGQSHRLLQGKEDVVKALFSADEVKEVTDLLRLGDRLGPPVLSTSGTGASNSLFDIIKGTGNSVTNDVVLESLKRKARGQITAPAKAESKTAKSAEKAIEPGVMERRLPPMLLESKKGMALKAASVLSNKDKEDALQRRKQRGVK